MPAFDPFQPVMACSLKVRSAAKKSNVEANRTPACGRYELSAMLEVCHRHPRSYR